MTTIKKEAAKDVATFATISEVSKSLTDTKAVLNQVVADLCRSYCLAPSALVYAWPWFPRMASKNG